MNFEHIIVRLLNGLHWPNTSEPKGRDLVLGTVLTHSRKGPVILREALRPMHLGIVGLSGVGKTYFLENLIRQDINHGTGLVVFDVHGDLADGIVAYLAERTKKNSELLQRVAIVEPFDQDYSIGFNPLERTPETSPSIQAQELAAVLRARWETRSFGTRTEELLRNSLFTLAAHNLTLVELPHLLTKKVFRANLVRGLSERAVADYWKNRYEPFSDAMKALVREPILTRVSGFLADRHIRDVVGQRKSTITFRDAMAKGLWVVVNLSKGKLGENSAVLGSLFFTKLELDVLGRARIPEEERKLFAVYADELQNLVGGNFATLIAEARKYRVSITAGHQFWRQLSADMRAAMLGVGSRVFFRLHYHDAQELAGEIDPAEKVWYGALLTRLPRGEAILRSGAGRPIPFTVDHHATPDASAGDVERVRASSRALFMTPRVVVEEEIDRRHHQELRAYTVGRLGRLENGADEQTYADFT